MLIKGAELKEWSPFASMFSVNLEEWGGLPESSTYLRISGNGVWMVANNLRDPRAPQSGDAIRSLTDFLGTLGCKHVWYGTARRDPPSKDNLERIGFKLAGVYKRLRKDLTDFPISKNKRVLVKKESLSADDFFKFFDPDCEGASYIEEKLGHDLYKRVFQHERVTPEWKDAHHVVYYDSKLIGALAYAFVEGKDLGSTPGPQAIVTPFFSREVWETPLRLEVINGACSDLKERGKVAIELSAEETQTSRLTWFRDNGFEAYGEYAHFYREIPLQK